MMGAPRTQKAKLSVLARCPKTTMRPRCRKRQTVDGLRSQKLVPHSSQEPLHRHAASPLDRAHQAAAKTVRGQPCRLARPRPSGTPGGEPPDPFDAPHPLRYPLVSPFLLQANGKRRRWPVQNLFSETRSLATLTHSKKVLDGHPSAFAKDDSIHEEKGGKKKRQRHHGAAAFSHYQKEPSPGISPGCRYSGSFLDWKNAGPMTTTVLSQNKNKKGSRPLRGLLILLCRSPYGRADSIS